MGGNFKKIPAIRENIVANSVTRVAIKENVIVNSDSINIKDYGG